MSPQTLLLFVIDALAVLFALIVTVDFVVGLRALWLEPLSHVSVPPATETTAVKPEPSDCHVGAIAPTEQVEPHIAVPDLAVLPEVLLVTKQSEPDYSSLTPEALRKLCQQRGITWRNAHGRHQHLKKAEMVEALIANDVKGALAIEPPYGWGHLPATA